MSDTVQTVLLIIAISSMPLGFVVTLVLWLLIRDNRRIVIANRVVINELVTRMAVIEERSSARADGGVSS